MMPAYNSESYIEDSLISILSQKNINWGFFEIIVVNDGSKDNTEKKVNDIKDRYPLIDIVILNKTNGGLSDARNFGLKSARGDYIWFFDSDDLMEEDSLAKIFNVLKYGELDLLSLGIRDVFGDYSIESNMLHKPINIVVDCLTYVKEYDVEYSACVFIAKRELLINNNLFFLKGVLSEDFDFVLRLYFYCKKISHIGVVCYNYIVKEGSLSRRKSEEYYNFHHASMIKIIDNLKNEFKDKEKDIYHAAILKYIVRIKIIALINLMNSTLPFYDKIKYYIQFENSGILNLDLPVKAKFQLKHKIIVWLVNFKLFYPLMYLKSKI
ncbi:glycosyltransferase family 2 protein [Acinetobacter lwoffii]|uniref:glycosyltransferase family 2 protein n=1 Tax=Acinetobacter lwoffii TaxID=28090 RepID=UPI00209B58FB|nr:glycosyltransferase [Acinetobacter lwoffii]